MRAESESTPTRSFPANYLQFDKTPATKNIPVNEFQLSRPDLMTCPTFPAARITAASIYSVQLEASGKFQFFSPVQSIFHQINKPFDYDATSFHGSN